MPNFDFVTNTMKDLTTQNWFLLDKYFKVKFKYIEIRQLILMI